MSKHKIISILKDLTGHEYIELTARGNAAIAAALSSLPKNTTVLIPEEGGWLSYQTMPKKLGLEMREVKCDDAAINVHDLEDTLRKHKPAALLYQNPGGYFAEQPMKKIYEVCKKNNCLVILDVSGSIGTELCDGKYADILVCSFGEWKLVEAGKGGFISCRSAALWKNIEPKIETIDDEILFAKILQKLEELPDRIGKLQLARDAVISDLKEYEVVHPNDNGFVIVVAFSTDEQRESKKVTSHFELSQRESLINYCTKNSLEWTECPRYIRLNRKAISIEIKRI